VQSWVLGDEKSHHLPIQPPARWRHGVCNQADQLPMLLFQLYAVWNLYFSLQAWHSTGNHPIVQDIDDTPWILHQTGDHVPEICKNLLNMLTHVKYAKYVN
jgi:hypothetical protein